MEQANNKVRTKTEDFKAELQKRVGEVLGTKVSKQAAWDLFKSLVKAPYAFIINNYEEAGRPAINYGEKHKELELPLSGVGTFKVITVGGQDNLSVKGRLYLSSSIDRAIKEGLGFEVPAEDTTEEETPVAPAADDFDI